MMKIFSAMAIIIILNSFAFGQSAYEFLRADMSPRAAALAGGFVANADDPDVVFYNPAGINFLNDIPISFSFTKFFIDINAASLASSFEIENIGRFAAAIQYVNYGDFERSDKSGNKLGNFGAYDFALITGYGNELGGNLYYGVNLKFIGSSIESYSSSAIGVDLGLHYAIPDKNWNLGFSLLNIGTQMSTYAGVNEELPFDMRVGFTKSLEQSPVSFYGSINRLNAKTDSFFDKFKSFSVGGEIALGKSIKIRLGFDNEKRKNMKIAGSYGLAGLSIGLGALIKNYNFNYAYSSWGLIGGIHRLGVATTIL